MNTRMEKKARRTLDFGLESGGYFFFFFFFLVEKIDSSGALAPLVDSRLSKTFDCMQE